MIREEYLRRLVDKAYIDIYLSGMDGARIYWPWRMMPVHEASKRYRNCCEKFIVDSSFSKPDITNIDVLDKAAELDAEVAVLADVYQDKDATVEAIKDGLDTVDDHHYDGCIMAPLQAPHDACYESLNDSSLDMVAIGGFKDATQLQQIQAAKSIRAIAPDAHIHGLGWGLSDSGGSPNQLVTELHENPDLLDSIDYSTPIQETMPMENEIDKGTETKSYQAAEAGAKLVRDLRRVSEYAEVESKSKQVTL